MFARNAPVFQLFGWGDMNRLTFAVSDALNTIDLSAGVREEDGLVHAAIKLFAEPHGALSSYTVEILFDSRPVRFHTALKDVSDWWAAQPGKAPAPVPAIAREPMYSTWYSYHQNVTPEPLLREIEVGRKIGMKAIIIDDGWQTGDNNRGYAYTGDWEPVKIADMKGFVDASHARDTAVLLWYSVPLVGEKSKIYEKFKGKYLRYWDGQGAYELDPRYPDVRAHIIKTYADAMRDWGVDGFKLDFLGRFAADENTDLTLSDGRDYASVNEAADRLFTDIMAALRAQNPNVMIEFRQPYIGPLMRKYGNMFRAGDTPNNAVGNRTRTIDLRLLSGNTAVHADMIMWHYDESVEAAALQFLNILYSVPQISVRLEDVPPEHFKMIEFYTRYWAENRDVLLDGELEVSAPLARYPLVTARGRSKRITTLYTEHPVTLGAADQGLSEIHLVNAKPGQNILVHVTEELGEAMLSTLNAKGETMVETSIELTEGAHALTVPPSGMARLRRATN